MDEDRIRQIVREEIESSAQTAQYGVARVPVHIHNNSDAPNLPPTSVSGFVALPANTTPVALAGVLGLLNGQTVNNLPNTTASFAQPAVYVFPIPVIYGFGVGVHSAFNGGQAPEGSMVFFENGNTLSGLWVRTSSGWRRMPTDGNPPLP